MVVHAARRGGRDTGYARRITQVDPANSRKMAARLQAASGSGLPVLLWTSPSAGHGFGTPLDERIADQVDVFAFLFDQLGVTYRPVGQGRALP